MSRSQSFLQPEILGLHVFCNYWRWFSLAYASYELSALPFEYSCRFLGFWCLAGGRWVLTLLNRLWIASSNFIFFSKFCFFGCCLNMGLFTFSPPVFVLKEMNEKQEVTCYLSLCKWERIFLWAFQKPPSTHLLWFPQRHFFITLLKGIHYASEMMLLD